MSSTVDLTTAAHALDLGRSHHARESRYGVHAARDWLRRVRRAPHIRRAVSRARSACRLQEPSTAFKSPLPALNVRSPLDRTRRRKSPDSRPRQIQLIATSPYRHEHGTCLLGQGPVAVAGATVRLVPHDNGFVTLYLLAAWGKAVARRSNAYDPEACIYAHVTIAAPRRQRGRSRAARGRRPRPRADPHHSRHTSRHTSHWHWRTHA